MGQRSFAKNICDITDVWLWENWSEFPVRKTNSLKRQESRLYGHCKTNKQTSLLWWQDNQVWVWLKLWFQICFNLINWCYFWKGQLPSALSTAAYSRWLVCVGLCVYVDQNPAFDEITCQLAEFPHPSCDQKNISIIPGVEARGRAGLPVLASADFVD